MSFESRICCSILWLILLLTSVSVDAQSNTDLEPIVVSIQPAVYWALPFWIALHEGFFEELGLDVTYRIYPSGAPQVEAAISNQTWDVGSAGSVPNIIGGFHGHIQTIAISNDESATNALVANAKGVEQWQPASLESTVIAVTANSTGHYAALACLAHQFPNAAKANFLFQGQEGVLSSLNPDANTVEPKADYGSLWAPHLYRFLDNVNGSGVICTGDQVGAVVAGGLMVRTEFGLEKPETVARFLAAWLRGIAFLQNPNLREESEDHYLQFIEATLPGYNISTAIEKDFVLRPMFNLQQQLALFDRSNSNNGPSTVDEWYQGMGEFLTDHHVINSNPPVETYLTDKYLKMIDQDEFLGSFTEKSSSVSYILPSDGDYAATESSSANPVIRDRLLVSSLLQLLSMVAALTFT